MQLSTGKNFIVAAFLCLSLASCASRLDSAGASKSIKGEKYISDGVLALVRAAPAASVGKDSGRLFGFVPLVSLHQGTWLSIKRDEKKIELFDGDRLLSSTDTPGLDRMTPGTYQVLHKQKAPLWYASDEYYQKRGMAVPPQGDRSRYLRGALGDFAIFIDKDLPLHSGPVWTPEVGGLRLDEASISRIYYTLSVGSIVEIK